MPISLVSFIATSTHIAAKISPLPLNNGGNFSTLHWRIFSQQNNTRILKMLKYTFSIAYDYGNGKTLHISHQRQLLKCMSKQYMSMKCIHDPCCSMLAAKKYDSGLDFNYT